MYITVFSMKVVVSPKVIEYLAKLVFILYQEGYFSYLDNSKRYVDELLSDIEKDLPEKRHRRAPKRYAKYGKDVHHASFKKNRRTTWYAFFTKYEADDDTIYLVRYIGNNHTEAHHLYEGFISD